MLRILLFVAFLLNNSASFAQDSTDTDPYKYSRVSGPAEKRFHFTIPPYGYHKVKELVSLADTDKNSFVAKPIADSILNTLSPEEKFTWCMAFPESYMQICSTISYDSVEYKIFRYLPVFSLGETMSRRQRDFLKENRALCIRLMSKTLNDSVFTGYNYKLQIRELQAVELVPAIISNYERTGDKDLLTLLIELMEKDKYQPWLDSDICAEMNKRADTRSYRKAALFSASKAYAILRYATEKYMPSFKLIPAGEYQVGKKGHLANPLRKVKVDSFWIAAYETTNREFAAFIAATGYITDAEKYHNAMVFEPGLDEFRWLEDSTACWRYPNGITRGGIEKKMDHPVTCVSYHDIEAYCKWAGLRLPTLDEWEIACRAGSNTTYFFGENEEQIGKYANV